MNTQKTLFLLLLGMVSLGACNNSGNNQANNIADTIAARTDTVISDVREGAKNLSKDIKEAINVNHDSDFAVRAAAANNEELKLLHAGLDNGTNKELKGHARMMIADHKKLGMKINEYCSDKGYILPEGDNGITDDEIDRLNRNNKGSDWDKAWVNKMMDKHQDAISMFEKGQDKVNDPNLKAIITGALPKLHSHYDMLKSLYDKMTR